MAGYNVWKETAYVKEGNKFVYNKDRSRSEADLLNMFFEEFDLPYVWNKAEAKYQKINAEYNTFIPKINIDKQIDDNSREQVENQLLDGLLSVITNPLNFSETSIPLDVATDNVKYFLKFIDKQSTGDKNSLNYLTPSFQSKTKRELAGGKRGIGPFALATAHHSLAQTVGLQFSANMKRTLSRYGITSIDGRMDHDFITIFDWLSAMINAHVDTAKDPYIIRMNVVPYTYKLTAFLLRSGFGGKTFLFLPQQILKDMSAAAERVSGYLDVDTSKSEYQRISEATKEVVKEYEEKAKKLAKGNEKYLKLLDNYNNDRVDGYIAGMMDAEHLEKNLNKEETFYWYFDQLIISKAFEELDMPARSLSELTTLSQVDTKKFGNNFSMYTQYINSLKSYLVNQKVFDNAKAIFTDTFLYEKIKQGIEKPMEFMDNKLLRTNPTFIAYRNKIIANTGGFTSKDESYIRNINRALEIVIKNNFFKDKIDHKKAQDLLYGKTSIPNRLVALKADILKGKYPKLLGSDGKLSNTLLEMIDKSYKYDNFDLLLPDFISYKENKAMDDLDNQMILSWEELLDLGDDPEYKEVGEFARDLVMYAYLTSGDTFGKNTIFNNVPNSFRKLLGYVDYMQNAENNLTFSDDDYDAAFKQFWYDDTLVPPVNYSQTKMDDRGEFYDEVMPGITVTSESSKAIKIGERSYGYPLMFTNTNARSIGTSKNMDVIFPKFVKYKINNSNDPRLILMYKLVGTVKTDTGKAMPVYKVTNKLGIKHRGNIVVDLESTSIFPFNNPYGHNISAKDILTFFYKKPFDNVNKSYVNSILGLDDENNLVNEAGRLKAVKVDDYPVELNVANNSLEDILNAEKQESEVETDINEDISELSKSNVEDTGNSAQRKYYEGDIQPSEDTIFVFGSNPEGRHGAGAAKVAITKFGARYGQGEGLQGNSYALPTKDLRVKENRGFRSISEEQIIDSIKSLYNAALQNPNKQFKVAYRNTTEKSLNGYTGLEMIDMFLQAGEIPSNVVFSKEWVDTGKFGRPNVGTQLSLNFEEANDAIDAYESNQTDNAKQSDILNNNELNDLNKLGEQRKKECE